MNRDDSAHQIASILVAVTVTFLINLALESITGYWGSWEFLIIICTILNAEMRIVYRIKNEKL